MALIDDIKIYLRISSAAYNTEITDLINAAKADIALGGVLTTSETDALYKQAISVYCKANFGYDNKDAERLDKSYQIIKRKLMLALGHSYYTVTFTASAQSTITFNGVEKETNNSDYTVVFYSKAGNQIPYTVNGGGLLYVDVSANTEVDLT